MGTRNLTAVHIDGEYKVAQYGQWDGYPEGQGMTALHFLRDKMDLERFKTALRKCSYISSEELLALWKQFGVTNDEGWVTMEQADAMKKAHPQFSRDTGTFEGFKGFNQTPLSEGDRFYFLREHEDGDYHGVRLAAKWDLSALPTDEDFLAAFKEEDEEE